MSHCLYRSNARIPHWFIIQEYNMFDEEIKITNEPPKEPRKPPALLIFGIAMIGGAVLVALGFRIMMSVTGAL